MTYESGETSNRAVANMNAQRSASFARWEAKLHAFVHLCDPVPASVGVETGPLHGVTVGVKDIIDVVGVPTRNGSEIFESAQAATQDAPVVAALRQAGAEIVGKTATTEFAFTDPTDCRNPYDLSRSPGGSSSGSGSAVAAGLVDVALGTQTAGSLCRPAAYCGCVGYKPTFGMIPTDAVTPLAPSFDTVGIIARSVQIAIRTGEAITPWLGHSVQKKATECMAGTVLFNAATPVAPETLKAFSEAGAALNSITATLSEWQTTVDIASVVADHRIVMNAEAAQAHGHFLADERAQFLKPKFKAGLQAGASLSMAEVTSARARLETSHATFWGEASELDVILTLPVPDGAPMMGESTGFQDWLTPWTVFGGPLVALPWGLDTLGRPRSVMLAGRPGTDATLLALAQLLEAKAPELPLPTLPD